MALIKALLRFCAAPSVAARRTSADREALVVEEIVARTADLVLKVTDLAERYECAEPSQAGAARVLVLRTTAAQGCALILSASEADRTPWSGVPCRP